VQPNSTSPTVPSVASAPTRQLSAINTATPDRHRRDHPRLPTREPVASAPARQPRPRHGGLLDHGPTSPLHTSPGHLALRMHAPKEKRSPHPQPPVQSPHAPTPHPIQPRRRQRPSPHPKTRHEVSRMSDNWRWPNGAARDETPKASSSHNRRLNIIPHNRHTGVQRTRSSPLKRQQWRASVEQSADYYRTGFAFFQNPAGVAVICSYAAIVTCSWRTI
jgi:hypothetical protein